MTDITLEEFKVDLDKEISRQSIMLQIQAKENVFLTICNLFVWINADEVEFTLSMKNSIIHLLMELINKYEETP